MKQRNPRCDIKIKPSYVAKTGGKFEKEILKYRVSTLQILMSQCIHSVKKFYKKMWKL